jgi:hypothetical protein
VTGRAASGRRELAGSMATAVLAMAAPHDSARVSGWRSKSSPTPAGRLRNGRTRMDDSLLSSLLSPRD